MAGVAIASYPPVEEDIARAHTAVDLHMPMEADQATARDTGLLHALAHVPATHTPTSDDRVADVPAVAPRAEDILVEDDPEAVARAVPDNQL